MECAVPKPEKPSRTEARRAAVYRFLDTCLEEANGLGGLPTPREAREMWGDIWLRETHHSTGIEGNKLTYAEVEALLRDQQPVAPARHKDYLEIRGYADAAQWVYTHALQPAGWSGEELLTMSEVRHVHEQTLAHVWQEYPHRAATAEERPGSFRRHDIAPFPGGMQPPSWPDIPSLLCDWIDRVNGIQNEDGPELERVAERHAEFERIHPFLDGNGRAGRLLLNLTLVRLGYPPAIIFRDRRKMYLAALRACDKGDPGRLGETIASAIIKVMKQTVFPCITGPGRYVLLSVLGDSNCSTDRLRRAAAGGKLRAERDEDGFWRSTPKYVEEYKLSYANHKARRNA